MDSWTHSVLPELSELKTPLVYANFFVQSEKNPRVRKQCPADGVRRIDRGVSPDRVRKTRFTPSESSAGHGVPPQIRGGFLYTPTPPPLKIPS